jgi:hypothetical protein
MASQSSNNTISLCDDPDAVPNYKIQIKVAEVRNYSVSSIVEWCVNGQKQL